MEALFSEMLQRSILLLISIFFKKIKKTGGFLEAAGPNG